MHMHVWCDIPKLISTNAVFSSLSSTLPASTTPNVALLA